MRVRVYLPPYLNRGQVDRDGWVELPENSTLKDLFRILKIPFPPAAVRLCRVNYEAASLNKELQDGDVVSFFSLISGG